MVNGHKSAAHTDSLDGGTGKTCLGGGMHCPDASSLAKMDYLRQTIKRQLSYNATHSMKEGFRLHCASGSLYECLLYISWRCSTR